MSRSFKRLGGIRYGQLESPQERNGSPNAGRDTQNRYDRQREDTSHSDNISPLTSCVLVFISHDTFPRHTTSILIGGTSRRLQLREERTLRSENEKTSVPEARAVMPLAFVRAVCSLPKSSGFVRDHRKVNWLILYYYNNTWHTEKQLWIYKK